MSTSKAFKFADRQTRYAVSGYFRQCSESFSLHIPIPDLSSLLLSYIYDEDVAVEYFNIARSDYFEISTDKLTIRSLNGIGIQNHSIFLNQWIDSTSNSISEWIFVIHSIANLTIFGLASSINDGYKNFRSDKPNYTIRSDGMLYYVLGRKRKCAGNCYEFNTGDTLKFTLDLNSDSDYGMLVFQVNNNENKICYSNIIRRSNISYKMVVNLVGIGCCVTLKRYRIKYHYKK